ncbi:MAG: hypothetical protein DMF58_09935 [Acidobacteria bacterium]|nr:MAG: hypothetical protein DMF58_09935 [Acidobacteriota bacterium]
MKSIKSFMAISLIAGAAHAAEPFSINLSTGFGTFTKQTQTSGKIETTNWISKSPTGEAVVVTMSKMPGKILDPAKLFASTRDALLKSVKGTLDNEQKLGPASEVLSFHSSSGAFLRSRLIASGDRLYQVLYVGHSAEQRENPAIAAMFDSFSIGAQ